MLGQLFSSPKQVSIYVEKISYFRTLAIFQGFHYEMKPVRTEIDGIDTVDLERVWARDLSDVKTKDDDYAAVLYLVPQYSNPAGIILSEEKSKEIVRLARKYNVLVICDDVYNLHCKYSINEVINEVVNETLQIMMATSTNVCLPMTMRLIPIMTKIM